MAQWVKCHLPEDLSSTSGTHSVAGTHTPALPRQQANSFKRLCSQQRREKNQLRITEFHNANNNNDDKIAIILADLHWVLPNYHLS